MKSESGTLVKAITILFAAFILFSSLPLQVSAENEMTPGIALENDLTLNTPHTLVGVDSSGTSLQPMVTETGKISVSVDGLGTDGSGTIQVEKPTGATVKSAYLIAAGSWGSQIPEGSVLINGNTVLWNNTATSSTCYNYWADVTSFVKPVVDVAPAGRIGFTITETSASDSDGEVLVVIFEDPNQVEDNTVILLFGCQDPTGDTFSIKLGDPINKGNANLMVNMGLGISFSYQASGGGQVSNVDVNGVRVTSSAGGEDDGYSDNGALLTVGGLDDSIENPSDPLAGPSNQRTDDELYNLLPFVNNGDTDISVFTQNPSNDDNIFFSYFFLKSTTAMVGEGILLSPASGNVSVGSQYTLASVVQDDDGNPLEGKEVNFSVVSGPNAGKSGSATTDAAGRANFSYSGTSTGTDLIEASFVNTAGETVTSNQASVEWTAPLAPLPVANFDSNVTLGIQPLTVSFYDLSENAASWHWNFGDGNSSELQNSTHTYFEPGYHTVSLTVNNSIGSSNTSVREDYIFVQALPIPDFSANVTEGTFPLTVQFTDESQYAESVEWNFGDGSSSTGLNPVHTYSEAGLYTVSLTATGNGTSVTKTVEDCINVTTPPVPDFSANVTEGTFPLTVQFTDESQYVETVEWNFGDGSSSTGLNPVHTYSEAGLYTVSLTATGNGTSVTKTVEDCINVTTPPVPDFSANVTEGTFPLSVQFTDESQYVETVEWNFGDGNSSTDLNPVHTYSEAGLYTVSLTATGNGTSVTKTVEDCINVTTPPVPDFSANVTEGTFPLSVQFTDESQYVETVEWNFGDGNSSTDLNPVHTYSEAGLYTVSLTATGNGTSVTKTIDSYINVTIPPVPAFSANITEGTFPLTVQFTDESQYVETVEWNFGDGSSSTGLNPVHTYSEAGLYTVSLTATGNGTSVTKTVEDCINVTIPPVPDFSANVTEGTFPLSVQFTDESQYAETVEWNFGDGSSSTGLNPVHTYSEAGLYTVSLTATGNGTSVTKTVEDCINVTIPPVPAFSANVTEGTFPLSVQFTDESQYAETVEWNFGDGSSSTGLNPVHTYSEAGLYTVSLTATGNGTSVTKTVEDCINVTIPPVPDFSANVTEGTFPLSVQFTDESQYVETVEWNFGDGSSSTGLNPVHTYSEAGLYTVSLTATGNGTSVTKTVEDCINVTIPPVPDFSANVTEGTFPLTVQFTDESQYVETVEWNFGDGSSSTDLNPVHTYSEAGLYTVSLIATGNGTSVTKTVEDCINVTTPPVPDFSANVTEGTFPLSVQFTDESQYVETVEWNFGDGNSSTDLNPVHTYSEAGLYTVSLTATGNGTSVTKTIDSYINVTIPPVPAFSANITEGLFPLTVQFTDESQYAETLEWNFGDGNSSNELNPIHTYSAAGLYSVSLTATGNGTSVTKTVENYINVTLLPIPDFGANVTTGPYPLTVQFMDNSSYAESVEWDFGDGSGSNERNPVHTYEERGLYTVTLGASGNGTTVNKTVEDFINVTIQPFLPAANFSVSLMTGPAPLTVRFTDESYNAVSREWDVDGDGQIDYTEESPVHTYVTPGSYNVSLYVSNAYGNNTKVVEGCINVLAHPVISKRTLSKASVYPGEEFTANLSIESAWDLRDLTVVEDIPAGWTLVPIDNAGAEFDSSLNKWVWENYSAGESRQLVYTLKAPLDSDFGLFEIEGNVSAEDLVSIPVEGENEVTVTPIADYNPKALKLLHVGDPDQEFNISTHMLCDFTWYVNGNEFSEGNTENSAYSSLVLSPEVLWENEQFRNDYTSVENSSLFAGKYIVTTRVSNGSAAINHTWNFLITDSTEDKENINNTVVLPIREVEENESVTFDFTEDPDNTGDNSILGVSFNASSAGNVSVFVEVLKDRASEVSEDPDGDVYQHVNIYFSNHTVMNETGSESKFIDFRVSRVWMETVVQGTVRLNRYHDGEWQSLNTWETGSDDDYYYFRAETPGFSPFSITAEKISIPRNGGSGTGSATISPASSTVGDGSAPGDSDLELLGEKEITGESQVSGSEKSIYDEQEKLQETGSEENDVSGTSSRIGFMFPFLLLLLIVGAYMVYRQTKENK